MPNRADLMTEDRRAKLAREMTHQPYEPYQPAVDARNSIGQWAQGVAERSSPSGMLSALASEANRYRTMPPEELAGNFGPSGGSGLVGMFAGKGAKTANLAALAKAEQLKTAGVPDEQIWKETGWTFGFPDKKPRFEIPDNAAQIIGKRGQYGGFELPSGDYPKSPMELMPHKQLQDAYPDVNNMDLSQSLLNGAGDAGSRGGYDAGGTMTKYGATPERISLYDFPAQTTDTAKSTTLHELQHAIQQREGFARGGNPEQFRAIYQGASPELNSLQSKLEDLRKQPWNPDIGKQYQQINADIKNLMDNPYDSYKRLAGESEARLTQARMNMTPEQRLANYPVSQFDVQVDQQIVRYGDGQAMSVPDYHVAAQSAMNDIEQYGSIMRDKSLPDADRIFAKQKYDAAWNSLDATKIAPPKTEFELAHEVARRNAALPVEQGGLGLHPDNTAMDRAKAMGFDTPAYHASDADIQAFDMAKSGSTTASNTNDEWASRLANAGVWSANEDVTLAARRALGKEGGMFGDVVYPLLIENPKTTSRSLDTLERKLKKGELENTTKVNDEEFGVTSYVSPNPVNIRSRFAAFDPARRNSANILAGGAAGAVGLSTLADLMNQQEYQ